MSVVGKAFLGIEIGGTKIQAVLGTADGEILRRWRGVTDPAQGGPGICDQLRSALKDLRSEAKPSAVATGFGGPVDWRTGRICKSHQIDGWEGFELSAFLADLTGTPAYVDNDANVAALGEAVLGAGRGENPAFYLTLGSGVGGGLVIGHAIYHGAAPGEAEFGHLLLDRDGTTVESRCSGWAVDRRIRSAVRENPRGLFARLVGNDTRCEARHLLSAVRQNDPIAQAIFNDLAGDLGFALSHVTHLLHPSVVILGGGLALIGEPLRDAVTNAMRGRIMSVFSPGPKVSLAKFGEDAVPIGALVLANQRTQEAM